MHDPMSQPTAAPGNLPSLAGFAMLEEKHKDFVTAVVSVIFWLEWNLTWLNYFFF